MQIDKSLNALLKEGLAEETLSLVLIHKQKEGKMYRVNLYLYNFPLFSSRSLKQCIIIANTGVRMEVGVGNMAILTVLPSSASSYELRKFLETATLFEGCAEKFTTDRKLFCIKLKTLVHKVKLNPLSASQL